MKRNKFILAMVLLCGFFAAQNIFSQSMYWPDGKSFATQKGKIGFEITGSTMQLKNNHLYEFINGQLREDLTHGYYTKEESQIRFYSDDESLVGYYEPSENRYYSVSKGGGKETLAAYKKDGAFYTYDDKLICKIDKDFDPVFAGFILYFFLGYTA